jgi:hypothetical protein
MKKLVQKSYFSALTLAALAASPVLSRTAYAQTAAISTTEPPPVDGAAKPKPPPYSLPFQLRPVAPGSVVRSDTAIALYDLKNPMTGDTVGSGTTVASMLLASYKVTDSLAPMVRLGVVSNSTSLDMGTAPPSGFNFINPVVGATYGLKFGPDFKMGLFLGLTIPVGGGGGDTPKPENAGANGAGIRARSAMDNAMFAVNDFTVFPGVGFAYVNHGFTAQAEATVLQLFRARGGTERADGTKANPDSSKTNMTMGLHLGYFFIPMLSAGAEIRHQRWLSTPLAVKNDTTDTLRDTTTFAIGPRLHFKLSEKVWIRPGLAFAMPLDDPMKKASYKIFQLDIPVAF